MAMRLNEYQIAAMRTAKQMGQLGDLNHAALGLASDTGEFITQVKRVICYLKPLDDTMRKHMLEELGDCLWFLALAAHALETDLEEVALLNIAKLKERFPNAYSDLAAEARADKGGLTARES